MVLPTSRLETDWVVLPVTAGRAEGRGVFGYLRGRAWAKLFLRR